MAAKLKEKYIFFMILFYQGEHIGLSSPQARRSGAETTPSGPFLAGPGRCGPAKARQKANAPSFGR